MGLRHEHLLPGKANLEYQDYLAHADQPRRGDLHPHPLLLQEHAGGPTKVPLVITLAYALATPWSLNVSLL